MCAAKMFEPNHVCRIISMADKNVMEVQPNGSVLITKWNNRQDQKFKTILINKEVYGISPLSKSTHAFDYEPRSGRLIATPFSFLPNQGWTALEIHPRSKICFITSWDGKALCNNGVGHQIGVSEMNGMDVRLHWKLEPTY